MWMGLVVQRSWVGLLVTKYDMAYYCVPWFPLLDLNHGIDDLEKLQLDIEMGMEDVNLQVCCREYVNGTGSAA